MLTKVEVRTDQGALLTLPLQDVSQGLIVESIEGLDPVKATIVSSSFAQLDGEQYQSARREKRNLIIKLALEPDYAVGSVQGLRNLLYQFFMTKQSVRLRFFSVGQPTVDIEGMVESFVAPKFTKEPTATISILCFDPDFFTPDVVQVPGNTVSTGTETTHIYPGSVETGVLFKLWVNRDISEFTIYHRPADDSLRALDFQAPTPMIAGDLLTISTQPGNKYAMLKRAGVDTSILYGISPQSNWINLFPGPNKLRVYAEGAAVPYTIDYTTKFGGL
ncbi:MAG TPA: phage tail family protein [Dermatophilaceae bacterium]|jgi:hypothetical protein|nr:phage tail family protein [Dermatophilaceae bacterium]